MSTLWTRIPREEAARRPLYGVNGWLALFVTLLMLETMVAFWNVFLALGSQEIPVSEFLLTPDDWAQFPRLALGILLVTTVIILASAFRQAPRFRPIALVALIARGPLYVAAYVYSTVGIVGGDSSVGLMALLIVWLVEAVLGGAYLQRSRRVRLTFESEVRAGLPDGTGRPVPATAATPVMPAPSATSATSFVPGADGRFVTAPAAAAFPQATEADWVAALDEFDGPMRRRGLWAELFARSLGDENRAKAEYLIERVRTINPRQPPGGH